jgi:mRNA-degrading endonuclease toxin of MazEF toxin-antitoxin module
MSKLPRYWISVPNTEVNVDWGAQIDAVASLAKADQVRVLDQARLGTKIGKVSRTALVAIRPISEG